MNRSITTLGLLLFAAVGFSDPVTYALYQNPNTVAPVYCRIDSVGHMSSPVLLRHTLGTPQIRGPYQSICIGKTPRSIFFPTFVAVAYILTNGGHEIRSYAPDGTYGPGDPFVVLGGTSAKLLGFADFLGNGITWLVVYRRDTNEFYCTFGGGVRVLVTSGVNAGTFTDPIGVCDADGDGDPDIILQDPATKLVKAMYFAGKTAVGIDAQPIRQRITAKSWLGVSDVDGNGSPDLFARELGSTQPTKLFFTVGGDVLSSKQFSDRSRMPLAFGQG